MKRFLFIMVLLASIATKAITQENKSNDAQKITTPGIKVPQLITTNIKRQNLSFQFNYNHSRFNSNRLSANLSSFISTKNKQINIFGSAGYTNNSRSLSDIISLTRNYSASINLGLNAKFFNAKNQFFEFGLQSSSNSYKVLDQRITQGNSQFKIGLGQGRIDFINDATIVSQIIVELEKRGELLKRLTKSQLIEFKDLVAEIKNNRIFVNRSYSELEIEKIAAFLSGIGVIKENGLNKQIIQQQYKYEPMFARTTGTQYKFSLYSQFNAIQSNDQFDVNLFSLGAELSFQKDRYINDKWQINTSASVFVEQKISDHAGIENIRYQRAGVRLKNSLFYKIDNKSSLRFTNEIGYSPLNQVLKFHDNKFTLENISSVYMNNTLQYEFMLNRKTAVNFGINLGVSKTGLNSGVSFGIRF